MVIDSNRFSMLFSKDVYILIIFCNFIIILFFQKYRKNLENKLEKFPKITDKKKKGVLLADAGLSKINLWTDTKKTPFSEKIMQKK